MPREFFHEGDVLMVSISTDPSTIVTRPATPEEQAEFNPPKPKAKKVKAVEDETE